MNPMTIDVIVHKEMKQVYKNLPHFDKIRADRGEYPSYDDSSEYTKLFLGGTDSKNIIRKITPLEVSSGCGEGCIWAPAILPEDIQIAMTAIYKKKLIPSVIMRISNVIGSLHVDYFGHWFKSFPSGMKVVTYCTVGISINSGTIGTKSIAIHKSMKRVSIKTKKQGVL